MEKELLNQILQMNLIGLYGIGLAFVVRSLLRKAGSRYCYYLWIIVFLNLVVPTVVTGSFSLIPKQLYQVGLSQEQETTEISEAESGYDYGNTYGGLEEDEYYSLRNGAVDQLVDVNSDAASDMTESAEELQLSERIWRQVLSAFGGEEAFARCLLIVWASVMMFLFAAQGAQYLKMRRRLKGLMVIEADEEKRVVTLRGLETPLLFGFLKPAIYLPDSLNGEERAYIIRHELYHRRRRDNIVKAAALCITIMYWYNPLVWLAFHFFGVDMELSCDEAVLLKSDTDIKKAYAGSLLKYGALQNHYILTSLTFGEPGLKARVKNVLRFQKRGAVITVVAVLAIVLLAVGLLVRPSTGEEALSGGEMINLEEILSGLDEEAYCQLLELSGYQVLLVAENGVYDTGVVEHGTCDATVYFPYEEQRLSASSTSCILQCDGESIYLPERDGSITRYSLDADSGKLIVEEVQSALVEVEDDVFEQELTMSEEEIVALMEISFVTRKELWTEESGFVTPQSAASEASDETDTEADPLAHTADQVLQLADTLRKLSDDDYCQILTIDGYSVLLVSTYGTYDAGVTDHAEISAMVYFPNEEITLASMGTAYPLQYGTDGIHLVWNSGVHTIYSLDENGDVVTEERELSAEEGQNVYDIPFVTKAELLEEVGVTNEELETAFQSQPVAQKEFLEQAQADGEALTVETLTELLSNGYSELTGYDYANCENAVLNYPESTGTLNYWYEFSLEYEGVSYTFRASYYKSDDSLSMLYISDDAGTEDIFSLYHVNSGSTYYLAAAEDFEAYLLETQDRSSWNVETFLSSIDLPDGYTLGSWDGSVGSLGATTGLGGGALIEPVAYELQGGDEVTRFVTDEWQYYSGFFSRIGEGFWFWDGDTLVPGILPLGNHMESSFVEMVEGTAKTAYLLEVEYELYTASGEARLEESGLDLNEIDLVSEYWYIIFVDDGVGADTGYCLGLAKNQFTKEEAITIAQSVVFAQ